MARISFFLKKVADKVTQEMSFDKYNSIEDIQPFLFGFILPNIILAITGSIAGFVVIPTLIALAMFIYRKEIDKEAEKELAWLLFWASVMPVIWIAFALFVKIIFLLF